MTNDEGQSYGARLDLTVFIIRHSFVIRHSSFAITTASPP